MTAFNRFLATRAANDPVWSRPMHVVVAGLYAVVVWLALLAWSVIVRGPWALVLAAGPVVVFGVIVLAISFGLIWGRLRRLRSVVMPDSGHEHDTTPPRQRAIWRR